MYVGKKEVEEEERGKLFNAGGKWKQTECIVQSASGVEIRQCFHMSVA